MSLSSCSEKTQPVCLPPVRLPSVVASSSQHSASPLRPSPLHPSVVGLSLGFSGFFGLFGTPALASFSGPNAQDSTATTSPVALVPISNLLTESNAAPATVAEDYLASGPLAHNDLAQSDLAQGDLASDDLTSDYLAGDRSAIPALRDDLAFESQPAQEAALNMHAIPSLSASAQAIYPKDDWESSSARSAHPFGGAQVSVEDDRRPIFTSPACEFSFCKSDDVALGREKPVSEEASEMAAELTRLMSHPALAHVTQSDIIQAEISLETEDTGLAQTEFEAESQNDWPSEVTEFATGFDAIGSNTIGSRDSAEIGIRPEPAIIAQAPDFFAAQQREAEISQNLAQAETSPDEELGSLRVQQQRSRESEELGILRLLQTAQAVPPPLPAPPVAFISGRLGFFATENVFRSNSRLDDRIMQSGITAYYFPQLSENTNLYAIAETSLARYGNLGSNYTGGEPALSPKFITADYNQTELQLGLRQRLLPRTYAQIGWRNQRIYSTGYRDKLFGINYLEAQLNHRSILNSKMWLDSFYQVRWGFAQPIDSKPPSTEPATDSSRLRQTLTLSLNYSATPELRTSLLYQLDFEDYTQMIRTDFSQQVIGIVSYNLTPESQLSVFGGTRFGSSSMSEVDLDDTFYGAGLNITVPLF